MRKLLVTRGIPGSGKSTWVKNHNLEAWTISPDSLRLLFRSPAFNENGKFSIDSANDRRVWELLYELLEERMERGEFIVIDATHKTNGDFAKYQNLASKYQYQIACVDFSGVELETCLIQNAKREQYKQVPEIIVTSNYDKIVKNNLPKNILAIDPNDDKTLDKFLSLPNVNLDNMKKIHIIGDIQGCYTPLKEYFTEGLKADEYYIFTGDYIDRGIENGETLEFIMKVAQNRNVTMLMGNHERHLVHWVADMKCKSDEFKNHTLPQLIEKNITKEQVKNFLFKLRDAFAFNYFGKNYICTHGGLTSIPSNELQKFSLITSKSFWNGVGTYSGLADAQFSENTNQWTQIHGHRNTQNLKILASQNSYNLEGGIEFGGELRIVTIDNAAVTPIEIPNLVYKKLEQRVKSENNNIIDPLNDCLWFNEVIHSTKISEKLWNELNNHSLIKVKKLTDTPHISSFSFTRKAFYDKSWDDINVKARGLFINEKQEICSRSYNKFFNLDENDSHKLVNLEKILKFPLTVMLKENGFLGIVGYDNITDSLFISSKSTNDGSFAEKFREIFNETLDKSQQQTLKRALKDQNASAIFEVIDPNFDPHIIEYSESKIILLDIVSRTENFRKVDYKTLVSIAKKLNLEHKKQVCVFRDFKSFNGWLANQLSDNEKRIEGYVIEDANGFHFKIKMPYYNFWKEMRSIKDKIITMREKGVEVKVSQRNPTDLGNKVISFLLTQDKEFLKNDIITIRKEFYKL